MKALERGLGNSEGLVGTGQKPKTNSQELIITMPAPGALGGIAVPTGPFRDNAGKDVH